LVPSPHSGTNVTDTGLKFGLWQAGMTTLFIMVISSRQATKAGVMYFLESIPGLIKSLKIWSQIKINGTKINLLLINYADIYKSNKNLHKSNLKFEKIWHFSLAGFQKSRWDTVNVCLLLLL
jgi:hypothetical protein